MRTVSASFDLLLGHLRCLCPAVPLPRLTSSIMTKRVIMQHPKKEIGEQKNGWLHRSWLNSWQGSSREDSPVQDSRA